MTDVKSLGRIAVVMGGKSTEREVSISSGTGVLNALKASGADAVAFDPAEHSLSELENGGFSRVFNMLHGAGGEDGTLQGLLEWLEIPYTGSGVRASAIGIDKQATCDLWKSVGLPVPEGMAVTGPEDAPEVIRRLGASIVVKPACDGSSFGVEKLENATEETLADAIRRSAAVGARLVAEKRIHGREFTCAVLGEGRTLRVLPIVEIIAPGGDYNSVNKYHGNEVQYVCPADLSEEKTAEISAAVEKAYRTIGARGWGRIDVMMEEDGSFYLLEINTNPGMTPHSLVPMAARAVGISYEDLVVQVASEARLDKTRN